jgi:hypothetical protein
VNHFGVALAQPAVERRHSLHHGNRCAPSERSAGARRCVREGTPWRANKLRQRHRRAGAWVRRRVHKRRQPMESARGRRVRKKAGPQEGSPPVFANACSAKVRRR